MGLCRYQSSCEAEGAGGRLDGDGEFWIWWTQNKQSSESFLDKNFHWGPTFGNWVQIEQSRDPRSKKDKIQIKVGERDREGARMKPYLLIFLTCNTKGSSKVVKIWKSPQCLTDLSYSHIYLPWRWAAAKGFRFTLH